MICLVRHGETAWSRDGRHTGRTDVPLTPAGERGARALAAALAGRVFARVWTSPLQRARRTCELAGFAALATIDDGLVEWDYGDYEGRTTASILLERPTWSLFRDGCPGGEDAQEVGARAAAFLARAGAVDDGILVFSSGHLLRMLATTWLRCDPWFADHLPLGTASLSVLGHEAQRATPALLLWNHQPDPT